MVASYVEVGSASDFVGGYAFAGFDIAKDSNFCHDPLSSVDVGTCRKSKLLRFEQSVERYTERTDDYAPPISVPPSVPTLVPFQVPTRKKSHRSAVSSLARPGRLLRTLWKNLGYAIFSNLSTSTKVTHLEPPCHKRTHPVLFTSRCPPFISSFASLVFSSLTVRHIRRLRRILVGSQCYSK